MTRSKREHVVNLYVSYEIKSALETLAQRRDLTLSSIIRRVFRIGIPILTRLWDTEDQLLTEQSELLAEIARVRTSSDGRKGPVAHNLSGLHD